MFAGGPVGGLADTAIPVARGVAPWQHDLGRRPADAAIGGARDQGLAAVVVKREPLLVEHRQQRAVGQAPRGDLVDAVGVVPVDVVVGDVLDPHGGSSG